MITVTVDLKQRSYPIFIGSGLLNKPGLLDPYIEGRDVLVVTNESIAPLYLEPLQQMLGQKFFLLETPLMLKSQNLI